MATFISKSPEETYALGLKWAEELDDGWVLGLIGDLGTGKTQLVKGLAAGLEIDGKVSSPTFTIVNEYSCSETTLYHLDLYRLETSEEINSAGLDPYLDPEGISVIEWIDRWPEARPEKLRLVHLKSLSETEREIRYEDSVS